MKTILLVEDAVELAGVIMRELHASGYNVVHTAGGLALVKELTIAMGGSVNVVSAPGQGSCFSVRLPIALPNI